MRALLATTFFAASIVVMIVGRMLARPSMLAPVAALTGKLRR